MKLHDFIIRIQKQLAGSGSESAALDARLLAGHALGLDRAQLLSQSERSLTADEIARIQALIERRVKHESVARIIGLREFWGLPFGLNEAALEPRPDSETVVEVALQGIRGSGFGIQAGALQMPNPESRIPYILDLGTGTGCLLLALLHELPQATGLGIDIAPRAVEQAQANAKRLNLDGRAAFRIDNWLGGITEKFDLIVSNPPYIARKDIAALMPEVRDHDPRLALDGGEDGLDIYRLLIPQLSQRLKPNGFAVFEVGQGQADAVSALFRQNGFANIEKHRDLGDIERCVEAHIP